MKDILTGLSNGIENFRVAGDVIILEFTNGRNTSIPYTKETEEELFDNMKNKFEIISKNKNFINNSIFRSISLAITMLLITILNALKLISGMAVATPINISLMFFTSLFTLITGNIIRNQIKLKRVIKVNEFLFKNFDKLNENVGKDKMLEGISETSREKIAEQPKNSRPYNINNVLDLPLEDLKVIKANIDECLESECPSVFEETNKKPKVRARTRN